MLDAVPLIHAVLPVLDDLVGVGLITLEKEEVLAYRGRGPGGGAATSD